MKIISISGPCASGKSTMIELLKIEYKILNSTYKKSKGVILDSTKLESKIDYVENWFKEILIHSSNNCELIISDRSPFDSLAYLKEGITEFEALMTKKFESIRQKGILYYSILLTAKNNELKNRIKSRFKNKKRDEQLYKQELNQLENSLSFYNEKMASYDYILDNTTENLEETHMKLKTIIEKINYS